MMGFSFTETAGMRFSLPLRLDLGSPADSGAGVLRDILTVCPVMVFTFSVTDSAACQIAIWISFLTLYSGFLEMSLVFRLSRSRQTRRNRLLGDSRRLSITHKDLKG